MHKAAGTVRREAAETMALLDAVMDGLTDEASSGALRDLCARQVRSSALRSMPPPSAKQPACAPRAGVCLATKCGAAVARCGRCYRLPYPPTPNRNPTLPLQVVEFLRWSVKHEVPQAAGGYGAISVNAQSLARRLLERLVHPQPYQRCAALRRSLTP